MHCPYCKSQSVHKHGTTLKGRQSYYCQICQRTFQKSRINVLGWIIGLLICVGLSPWLLNKALQIVVAPSDTGELVDAVVVLGRGLEHNSERTLAAAQLWNEGRAPHVFMSGIVDAPVMIKLAAEMGVDVDQVSGERCSQSTWENALYSQILLSSQGAKKILLVTDDTHIVRATLTFRGFGFDVIPYPVHSPRFRPQLRLTLYEALGLIHYGLSGKLQPPTAEVNALARKEANSKLQERKCSLLTQ